VILILDLLAGIAFVLSSGLLFGDKHKRDIRLVIGASVIAIISTILLFFQIYGYVSAFLQSQSSGTSHREAANGQAPGVGQAAAALPISRTWFGQLDSPGKRPTQMQIYREYPNGPLLENLYGCKIHLNPTTISDKLAEYEIAVNLKETGWGAFPNYRCLGLEFSGRPMGRPWVVRLIPNGPNSIGYTMLDGRGKVIGSATLSHE
jgi:hypothetical protein